MHDLSHSYASWLLQGGISLARVGTLLGHVSPLTTQRYTHLDKTPADDVLDVLDALGARRAPDPTPEPDEPHAASAEVSRRAHLRVVR